MADIHAELLLFKNATYGEDVRDAMISSINAINEQLIAEEGIIQGHKKEIETNLMTASKGSFTDGNDTTLSNLLSQNSTKLIGLCYRLNHDFTTTNEFAEGAGVVYPAGTRVYWPADESGWKTLQGSIIPELNTFKSEMQTSFQNGVNRIASAIRSEDSTVNTSNRSVSGLESAIASLSGKRYQTGYNNGYNEGNSDGYTSGYSSGRTDGYNSGYETGKTDGYGEGYSVGKAEGAIGEEEAYETGYRAGSEAGFERCKTYALSCVANNSTDAVNSASIAKNTVDANYRALISAIDDFDKILAPSGAQSYAESVSKTMITIRSYAGTMNSALTQVPNNVQKGFDDAYLQITNSTNS